MDKSRGFRRPVYGELSDLYRLPERLQPLARTQLSATRRTGLVLQNAGLV